MSTDYDVIVIGAGSPGEHCAGELIEGGLRVAIVERELVGGECSYWACIPSKTLLRPGEAVHGRARGGRHGGGRRRGGARLARLHGVEAHRHERRCAGSTTTESICCAARAGSPGRARSRSTACATPPSTSSSRRAPTRSSRRSRGSSELDGIWTNREATAMTAIPRRLLVIGGGPVGVELAQAVRRLGGEAVLLEGADHVLPREPAPLGEALGEVLRRDGIEVVVGAQGDRCPARGRGLRPRARRRPRAARRPPARRHRPAPARRRAGPRDGRHRARPARHPGRRAPARRRGAVGDRRHRRHLAADPRRQVPGRGRGGQHPRRVARGQLRGGPAGRLHRPAGGVGRCGRCSLQRNGASRRAGQDRDLHARVRRVKRLPDAAERRRAADRRIRARPRGGRVAPAGHAGHPRRRPASRCCATRSSRSRPSRRSTSPR